MFSKAWRFFIDIERDCFVDPPRKDEKKSVIAKNSLHRLFGKAILKQNILIIMIRKYFSNPN